MIMILLLFSAYRAASVPQFDMLGLVGERTKNTNYNLSVPKDFKSVDVKGLDNAKTYVYQTKDTSHFSMIRIGSTFVGQKVADDFAVVSTKLKKSDSAFFQSFASQMRSGVDYRNLRLGAFVSFSTAGVRHGLISNVALETLDGQTRVGRLVLGYEFGNQYALLLVADKATWSKNQDTWQLV